ncbi:MAG: hypothetical protein R2855_19905 [Thermomicrobiales bacterium]
MTSINTQKEGNQRKKDREHQAEHEEVEDDPAPWKLEPSQHIGGHGGKEEGEEDRHRHHDDGVLEVGADVGAVPGALEIVPLQGIGKAPGAEDDLGIGLERGHHHPEERKDDEDGPDDQQDLRKCAEGVIASEPRASHGGNSVSRICLDSRDVAGRFLNAHLAVLSFLWPRAISIFQSVSA